MSEVTPPPKKAGDRTKELGVRGSVVVVFASQIVGVLALIGVPIILARTLSKADYGLYAQFQMLLQTFLIFAIAGFPEALIYFVARRRESVADFLLGALVQLGVALILITGVLALAGSLIVGWIANDQMIGYLLPINLAVVFYALGDTVLVAQTAQRRFRTYSVIHMLFAFFQTAVVASTAILLKTLDAVIWAYVVTGAAKAVVALAYIGIETKRTGWTARPRMLREQWAYSLPYTATQTLKKINGTLHKFFISSSYSADAYAAYDIGTKNVPALGLLRGSFVQVMTPHFAEMEGQKRHQAILTLWHASSTRLGLVYFPIAAVLVAFAPEAITVLFTSRYVDAIPIFRILTLVMVWECLSGIEALLKAFAQNRFILWTTALQFGITLAGSWVALKWIGLAGPAVAVVVSYSIGQWIRIGRVRTLLNVRYSHVLPWKHLGKTLALAVAAAAVGCGVGRSISSPVGTLAVGIPVSALLYSLGALVFDLVPPSERARLPRALRRLGPKHRH